MIKTALGQRLREVRKRSGDMDRESFAATLGVSAKTLANYERGDNEPPSSVLCMYRDTYSINLNWLLSGDGEMLNGAANLQPLSLDDWTMRRLATVVTSTYEDSKIPISPENVTVEASRLYNILVGQMNDPEDREEVEALIPHLKHTLRKRLSEATSNPGSGKRSA